MDGLFFEECAHFFAQFEGNSKMVLATSLANRVSARMMSVVIEDGMFYFQTDCMSAKYHQLIGNPYVALCKDNCQVEGTCEELGRPKEHPEFCRLYREYFPSSYEKYTHLENERLIPCHAVQSSNLVLCKCSAMHRTIRFCTGNFCKNGVLRKVNRQKTLLFNKMTIFCHCYLKGAGITTSQAEELVGALAGSLFS